LECAGFLQGLGFDTSVLTRSLHLRNYDQELVGLLVSHMETVHGTKFLKHAIIQSIEKLKDNKLIVRWKDQKGNMQQVFILLI
jgi:pyruvate/2-oxoglutarate dehydrogenase complex dihydrolipoamide dehydrogenase (E3) component